MLPPVCKMEKRRNVKYMSNPAGAWQTEKRPAGKAGRFGSVWDYLTVTLMEQDLLVPSVVRMVRLALPRFWG